jgi:hypothetical protein
MLVHESSRMAGAVSQARTYLVIAGRPEFRLIATNLIN